MTGASSPPAWMQAADLPQAWRGQCAWRVLVTDFGNGDALAQLWQTWADDPDACHMLHVVVFTERPPPFAELQRTWASQPDAAAYARALEPQWFGWLPGLHRLALHGGRLQLTVCVGSRLALLRDQQFSADSIVIGTRAGTGNALQPGGSSPPWDSWALKALARLCRRGSTLAIHPGSGLDMAQLAAAGWAVASEHPQPSAPARAVCSARYLPSWQLRSTRVRWARTPPPVSRCVVVGAGLAGAGVAGALALRGWEVTVLDAAPEPAAGASGLPVGLFAPQISRDDGPRSRLSRAGIRATLQAAQRVLVRGQDWDPCGIAHIDATTADLPPDWPEQAHPWAATSKTWHGADKCTGLDRLARPDQAIWHAVAGWIKPQQLVRAWLAQPGVRFQGNRVVQSIRIAGGQWQLFGPHEQLLAETEQLVLAGAGGSQDLLHAALAAARQEPSATRLTLAPVDGQVSWALHQPDDGAAFPRFPVNGAGSVAAHVPGPGGSAWFAGATYEAASGATPMLSQSHAHNLARLAQLLPAAAALVAPAFADGTVHAWRGTRWTLADRLPVAGAWPTAAAGQPANGPGLWLSTAMGSRGLTYAALCGELIAAQLGGEPLPLDARLHRSIDVARVLAARRRTPTTS